MEVLDRANGHAAKARSDPAGTPAEYRTDQRRCTQSALVTAANQQRPALKRGRRQGIDMTTNQTTTPAPMSAPELFQLQERLERNELSQLERNRLSSLLGMIQLAAEAVYPAPEADRALIVEYFRRVTTASRANDVVA